MYSAILGYSLTDLLDVLELRDVGGHVELLHLLDIGFSLLFVRLAQAHGIIRKFLIEKVL